MKISKILLATDFSQLAKNALLYALELCQAYQAELTVLHVYRADFGVPVPETLAFDMLEARRKHAQNLLQSFLQGASEQETDLLKGLVIRSKIEMGLAVDAILETAQEEDYDLIIMGTKGEHNLSEVIFGSITSQVLKHSPRPVLVIPEACRYPSLGLKNLALASDLSPASLKIVPDIKALSDGLSTHLHLVHVSKEGDKIETLPQMAGIENHEIQSSSVRQGLDVFVKDKQIDVLVLLQQKRGWWEGLLHSSQTKSIALNSSVPLLILREV